MRISLCSIVRDEAQSLARCLSSLEGVVDELCVLDTGSTDGTPELARSLGARTGHFTWCEDFSAARNASLALATGDWVLVLDADEQLASDDARAKLEAFATHHSNAIGRVRLTNVGPEGASDGSSINLSRFFPRTPELCFSGRVHEQLSDSSGVRERMDTGVELLHHGYSSEALVSRDKLTRNRRLVEAALKDEPEDAYLWYQLGRTEFVAEEHTAALRACSRAIELLDGAETPYVAMLFETAAYSLRQLGRSAEGLTLLERIGTRFSRRPDTCFAIALLNMDLGKLAEADAGFRACLELDSERPDGGESARSASTWAPAFNLGVMHEVLQHTAEARRWYERALAFHPQHAASHAALERCA